MTKRRAENSSSTRQKPAKLHAVGFNKAERTAFRPWGKVRTSECVRVVSAATMQIPWKEYERTQLSVGTILKRRLCDLSFTRPNRDCARIELSYLNSLKRD